MADTGDARARNRLLLVLFLGVLMAALDIAIVGPALPAIRGHFGVDSRAISWLFSIYVLTNLIGTPVLAKLSDLFGRRPIYVLSVGLFAAGSLLVAAAPSYALLLIGRAVQGLGAGGVFPVASAVIGDTFPPEQRGGALGLIGAVFGIAFLAGPILGGVLLMFGWEWLFLINLPLAAGVIVASLRRLPSTRAAERLPFDWAGTALLAATLAALAGGLSELAPALRGVAGEGGLALPLLALALALLPAVWLVERRAADPVLDPRLFRSRQVVLVAALAVGAGLSEAVTLFVPSLLVAAFGLTPSAASFLLLPMVLAMAVASPVSGRALDRVGSRVVVLAGTALIAAGLLLESALPASMPAFYAFSALFGLGIGVLLGASLRYILLNETPPEDRAAAQGMLTIFLSVGQLLGAALIGAVAAAGGDVTGYGEAFALTGGVMLVLAAASLALKGRAEELRTVHRNEGVAAA